MKLLFTHSYFYKFDPKQWADKRPYPPYGTIYAAALMHQQGYSCSLHDNNLRDSPVELKVPLSEQQPDCLVIYDDGFNYLTKMCLTKMREAAFEMIRMGKEKGCTVILSSSDSTDHYGEYLIKGADYVLLGEGEQTLLELIKKVEKGPVTDKQSILGIAYKDQHGTVVQNPRRPVIKQLDDLPDPLWDLVDVAAYQKIWMDAHGYFSLNIATTRGCPYKCNWCAKPIYGNRYNSRSPKRVVAELQQLSQQYGADYFWVCDDIFGLKPGWVQQFRNLLEAENLKIRYKIQSRVDLLLKEDSIEALAASGLDTVWVGAESGSQKILDAMDKGTEIRQIYEATELLQSKGVKVAFFLQFGYLGEQMEDIQQTINMVLRAMPDDIGISVSYPLPGTTFYDRVKAQLQQKQNWEDSDDLDMMYEATYSAQFYKRLHRYVHKVFRRKQGWNNLKLMVRKPQKLLNKQILRSALLIFYYTPGVWIDQYRLQKLS